MLRKFGLASSVLLSGCHFGVADTVEVPSRPISYAADIHTILENHCIECHGFPSNRGAPTYFRLDLYDDTELADGTPIDGAATMAPNIHQQVLENRMPPSAEWGDTLGDNDKKIIELWYQTAKP